MSSLNPFENISFAPHDGVIRSASCREEAAAHFMNSLRGRRLFNREKGIYAKIANREQRKILWDDAIKPIGRGIPKEIFFTCVCNIDKIFTEAIFSGFQRGRPGDVVDRFFFDAGVKLNGVFYLVGMQVFIPNLHADSKAKNKIYHIEIVSIKKAVESAKSTSVSGENPIVLNSNSTNTILAKWEKVKRNIVDLGMICDNTVKQELKSAESGAESPGLGM